jgi:DNA-binding NarL/FixJ family response regulator
MSAVVFLTSDLMFSSQVLGATRELGHSLSLAANPADVVAKLAGDCRLVLVDLTLPGLHLEEIVAAVRKASPDARIVAFGPHVDEQMLVAAQAAGADLVLSRGQFHKQYAELLRHL